MSERNIWTAVALASATGAEQNAPIEETLVDYCGRFKPRELYVTQGLMGAIVRRFFVAYGPGLATMAEMSAGSLRLAMHHGWVRFTIAYPEDT